MRLILLLLFALCPHVGGYAEELFFQGHLSQQKLSELTAQIHDLDKSTSKEVRLVVESQTGDLPAVLDTAKTLFSLREAHGVRYILFINDEALGPAAVLPFLADELYISPNVAWGSIVSRQDSEIPLNVLRSRIQGLIRPDSPHEALLKKIASAMIDPDMELDYGIVKKKGETLVLNHYQLKQLDLVKGITTVEEFSKKSTLTPQEQPIVTTSFEESLKEHVHFSPTGPNRLGYIDLTDRQEAISQATWIYFNTALNAYKKSKPCAIVLEMNSPGGEVFAAERISDALKEMDTQYGIPVICYINNWAISAGAMLAFSCRYIVASKDASMGAAEPIIMGGEGKPETASEKVNSALRTDFANRAKFFNRNPYIAEAMVDKDIILVKRHGDIIKLDSEDQIRKGGIDPDTIFKPKGKLLTLNSDQLLEYGVANFQLSPERLQALTPDEIEKGIYPISKSALAEIPFFKQVPNLQIEVYHMNWQTRFLALLASPAISSLLFMVMLIAFYMELSSGGFGLAGAVALISLFLVLLSSFALEAIHWLEPILLFFGLALVFLEVVYFPTLGILGVIGAIFMIMGLAGMMLPGIESISYQNDALNAAGEYVLSRLAWLSGALLIAFIVIIILSRYMWPKIGFVQKFILTEEMRSKAAVVGSLAASPLTALPEVGQEAICTVTLRPAGKVRIQDQEYDAISTGNFIQEGAKVRVVRIEGAKVIVEEMYE